MERVGVYLTETEIKKLRGIQKKTGLSVAELIRRAVDTWLEEYEKKEKGKKLSG
ncbi:MAG: ribbon-helix-helix domain-containing protein [Deltaproteobacteria bacterium]|nr:ribbon-helix-helix domain-containing protein [Deltaproteobacteria bacterium]MBM4322860.1 ribbon-helix-helix domain-containing protein [Deltaproteobacteria bacterium]MBM4347155.1 ribbon-helix-helix domain-containing protein [Deltaproteobacteria bacterium]